MCQNLMILARMGDLRTRPALGAFPPLVLRCSSGLSRRRVILVSAVQPSRDSHFVTLPLRWMSLTRVRFVVSGLLVV
jgi:hypothetical protein